jgi:hypothetical protein
MKRKIKGLVYFLTVVGILIIGTLIVFRTQSERIAIRLGEYATARYGKERNLSMEVRNIGGSLLRDIRLEDVCISYTGEETPRILLSAPGVYGKFNLASILLGKVKFDSLAIESPKLIVPKRPDGSRIYPTGDPQPQSGGRQSPFEISRARVTDASIVLEDTEPGVMTGLNALGSYRQDEDGSTIVIEACDLKYGKTARIEDLAGILRSLDDRIEIREAAVKAANSRLRLSGFLGREPNDSLGIAVEIDSLDLGEVAGFYGSQDTVGVGNVSGTLRVAGAYSDILVDLDISGEVGDWTFDNLLANGSYKDRTITIAHLTSVLNETLVGLSGEYALSEPPRYEGVIAFSDLDLDNFIRGERGDFSSDIDGNIRFKGVGLDAKRFELMTWPDLDSGRYRDWVFDSIRGRVDLDSRSVTLEDVKAGLGRALLTTSGPIDFDGNLDLGFSLSCPDLEDLGAYHEAEGLAGSLESEARIAYLDGVLDFSLGSIGMDLNYRGTLIDSLVLDLDIDKVSDGLRGMGQVFASDVDLHGFKATEFISDIHIDGRTLEFRRLVFTRENDALLGAVGALEIVDDGFNIGLENLFVELGGFIWENTDTIVASYRQDSLAIDDFELSSGMGRVMVMNSSYARDHYSVESHFEDFDLGLLNDVLRAEIPTGVLRLALRASGNVDSLAFDMDFDVAEGQVRSVGFEDLSGELRYDGRDLLIDRVSLTQKGGSVSLEGLIPLELAPARVSELVRAGKGYDIVTDLGRIAIHTQDIDISLLEPLLPPVARLHGFADLAMEISGNKANPRIVTTGRLKQASYGRADIGEVAWDLMLEDSLLTIAGFTFGAGEEIGEISGNVPVAISMLPFTNELLKRPLDVSVRVEGGNMGLLCEVFPRLRVCSGTYAIDLRIQGSAEDPTFHGYLELADARIRLEGVAQDLRDIHLTLAADGKHFDLKSLRAEDGALNATGFFTMTGTKITGWVFDVQFDDFALTEFEDFFARVDGSISITTEYMEPEKPIPRITGSLGVREGEYFYVSGAGGGEGPIIAPSASPPWLMNVTIQVPNAFWIRGDDINAEFQGHLSVKRTREGLLVLGTLRTLRGSFYVYHNAFRITRGEFRFADVKSLRNAYIDLEANSRVLDEKIEIVAKGYVDKLDISATSESGWSETQIFEALAFRKGEAAEEGEERRFSNEFLRAWGVALVNRLGDDVARELHLDEIGIEVSDVGKGDALAATRITVGKYFADRVYMEYTQALGSLYGDRSKFTQRGLSFPERQLSVEYRLSDRFSVEGETGTLGGLGYFDVDLKFRFGY